MYRYIVCENHGTAGHSDGDGDEEECNFYLISLANCWMYCKLKLHSSPNTIYFTVEII